MTTKNLISQANMWLNRKANLHGKDAVAGLDLTTIPVSIDGIRLRCEPVVIKPSKKTCKALGIVSGWYLAFQLPRSNKVALATDHSTQDDAEKAGRRFYGFCPKTVTERSVQPFFATVVH